MSAARSGREREYRVRSHLESYGWRPVMRAAASKGSADLMMCHAIHGGALVQVGTPHKKLGPADRARLVADATDSGCLALLAIVVPGVGIQFWHVTSGTPSTWVKWEPGGER